MEFLVIGTVIFLSIGCVIAFLYFTNSDSGTQNKLKDTKSKQGGYYSSIERLNLEQKRKSSSLSYRDKNRDYGNTDIVDNTTTNMILLSALQNDNDNDSSNKSSCSSSCSSNDDNSNHSSCSSSSNHSHSSCSSHSSSDST